MVIITPESCDGATKPSPDLYLKAAEQLTVNPEDCIVIEDSPSGIESALNANMRVIALSNYHLPLIDKQSLDVVFSLQDSALLPNWIVKNKHYLSSNMVFDNILSLDSPAKDKLARDTYKIYRTLFSGRSYTNWRNLFFDKNLREALICTVKNQDNQIVGFHLLTAYLVKYQNEIRLVVKLYMGVLPQFRGSGMIRHSYFKMTRYIYPLYKTISIDVFENITSPAAYANACRFFGDYLLIRHDHQLSQWELHYLAYLNDYFHYQQAGEQPYVIRSASAVHLNQNELNKTRESDNKHIQFFVKSTHLAPGVGLACLIHANPGFLTALRWFIIKNYTKEIYYRLRKKLTGLSTEMP